MAPDSAQQGGAWPHRQCQHDGKDSSSEHVEAHPAQGKTRARLDKSVEEKNPERFRATLRLPTDRLRDFAE
jgi:hypothetical protein